MEKNKNLVDLKQAVANGMGRIAGRDVYPVFDSIKQIDGVLYGDLIEYSDAFGNRYPLESHEQSFIQ